MRKKFPRDNCVMTETTTCVHCTQPTYAVDTEYDEPYCKQHFEQQQRSSEPIDYPRYVEES